MYIYSRAGPKSEAPTTVAVVLLMNSEWKTWQLLM
jgi:hypothetical protein